MVSGLSNRLPEYKVQNIDWSKNMIDKFNLVILGPQGSGKGTQAELLAKKYKMKIIAPGDIARKELKLNSPLAGKIKKYVDQGALIPNIFINKLIYNKLKKSCSGRLIFDGFPRNFNQAKMLEKYTKQLKLKEPIAIYLKISRQTAIHRISARRVCPKCNLLFYPKSPGYQKGICPKCRTKIIQRPDDNPKAVKKRLTIYYEQTEKNIDFYRSKHRLIEIDGEPKISLVWKMVLEKLNDYLKKSSPN